MNDNLHLGRLEGDLASKLSLLCGLRRITRAEFVRKAVEKEWGDLPKEVRALYDKQEPAPK